jgi:GH43 family beta-xylosidase
MFDNNPIPVTAGHNNPKVNTLCNPDPYMIYHDGWYYSYTTGWEGVNVLRSQDLQSFEHMGYALSREDQLAYWAPAVIFYEGKFYMYYSSIPDGETDPHLGYMKVAVADNPLGPFEYQKTLFDKFTIDADVVVQNNELYLFYVAMSSANGKDGVMIFLDKLLDPFTLEGKPRMVVAPTIEEEVFIRNRFGDGKDWYTIEAPCYFERGGVGFLLYSGNAFMHEDYFVGYATCDAGLPLSEAVFQKHPSDHVYAPLIGKDEFMTGCGHNSVVQGPNGELLMAYHGRDRAETVADGADDGRRICISELEVDGKNLKVVRRKF